MGALWWLYRSPQARQVDSALPTLQSERIVPSLALMQLAGDPDESLAYQALNAGELETSRALAWVGLEKMSAARIALLLKLAQHFAADDQPQAAQQLYQQARALAVLDTALTPVERSQALLNCLTGLQKLGEQAAALDVARQVLLIVQQVPDLLPAQRSQLLRDLEKATLPLQTRELSRELTELLRNPYLAPQTTIFSGQWPRLSEVPPVEPTLLALVNERQQVAKTLAIRLLQVPLVDAEAERQQLARTLLIEDQQRTAYYDQIFAMPDLTFSLQFWALQQKREWLILKLAVAQRVYGIPLVVEWETESATILQTIAAVTADLHQALLAVAQTESPVDQQLAQRFFALTWLAQQIEFGFYPRQNATEVSEQLRVLQGEMRQAGLSPALPVAYRATATPPSFQIIALDR
ncbi:MAG: hypothetical protein KF832_11050 [Caldilineaceae bacterium]|nr:hypothetical protein [Caldilineaceae bacterium]